MEHYLREAMTAAFTLEQRAALATRQADQDRTVEAVHQLNTALVAAASGREAVWRRNVADALEILHEAVKHRGSSVDDHPFVDLYGKPGDHQDELRVHGREGEPCRRCRAP